MKGPLGLATLALFVLFSAPAAALAEGQGFGYAFTSPMSLAGIGARSFWLEYRRWRRMVDWRRNLHGRRNRIRQPLSV